MQWLLQFSAVVFLDRQISCWTYVGVITDNLRNDSMQSHNKKFYKLGLPKQPGFETGAKRYLQLLTQEFIKPGKTGSGQRLAVCNTSDSVAKLRYLTEFEMFTLALS